MWLRKPDPFVSNQVTGIFFESKIDYTTWFGDNVEYIHGIQVSCWSRLGEGKKTLEKCRADVELA